jgi:hypothetical protein
MNYTADAIAEIERYEAAQAKVRENLKNTDARTTSLVRNLSTGLMR